MAINFPNNPAVNDTFTAGGINFTFTGVKWESGAVVELSSDATPTLGGHLNAGAKNINNVGVITATGFSGSLTGNVTGNVTGNADTATVSTNAQGLTGDPSIQVTNATVLGNLDVQGTTTTIDTAVTAVDSLAVDGAGSFGGFVDFIRSASDGYGYLGIGPGGSNEKATFVNRGGEIDLEFYSNYSSSATVSINSDGTATFDGKVDVNNELHVHRASTTSSNALLALHSDIGGTKTRKSTIRADGSAEFAGTISDSLGELRQIPRLDKTTTYTITASDSGKAITADADITIPNNVMSVGDTITIIADGSGSISIIQDSGLVMYNSADGTTGNRTLGLRGMATIWFKHPSYAYISGSQLS